MPVKVEAARIGKRTAEGKQWQNMGALGMEIDTGRGIGVEIYYMTKVN